MSDSSSTLLSIGVCRVCNSGPLGLRVCGACESVVVLCDECDSAWRGESLEDPPGPLPEGTLPCPCCLSSLIDAPSRWASREEADACDWLARQLEESSVELQEVVAFDPKINDSREH